MRLETHKRIITTPITVRTTPTNPSFEIFSLFIQYVKGNEKSGLALANKDMTFAPAVRAASVYKKAPIEVPIMEAPNNIDQV